MRYNLTEEQKGHIRLWVRALRSQRFLQGVGRLAGRTVFADQDPGEWRYCCLGVACEVALEHGVAFDRTCVRVSASPTDFTEVAEYDGMRDFLPRAVREWLGFDAENPCVLFAHDGDVLEEWMELSVLNDEEFPGRDCSLSFDEIADLIEHTYLENADEDGDEPPDAAVAAA